ncbi:phage terminase large subunit, partial [Helicobacter rodentium]
MKLKIKIAPAFKALFDYKNLSNYREFIFYGGRASGKTYHIRLALTLMCLREKNHFIIFREVEQQIQYARDDFKAFLDEVGIPYTLQPLKESIEYKDFVASVTNFQITFYNGSTILLSFINDKVSKKRKSLRFDLRGAWIDEANFVTSTIRNDLLPSIRG